MEPSFSSIMKYVYLMINFFRSYKVYFLDPYITYESSNKLENRVDTIDNIDTISDIIKLM